MPGATGFLRSSGLTTTALAIAALLAAAAGVLLNSSKSESHLASVVDIASLLSARSPGSRPQAKITKNHRANRDLDAPAEPLAEAERVLGNVFPSGTGDHLVATPEELLGQIFPFDQGLALADGVGIGQLTDSSRAISVDVGRGVGGGGGSSGGSGGGNASVPPIAPEQIPAVPEPSTWALMLMGAAMCGASMRRQKNMQLRTREA